MINSVEERDSNQADAAIQERLTPDLIRKVTAKVYRLWLRDLELAQQRKITFRPHRRR